MRFARHAPHVLWKVTTIVSLSLLFGACGDDAASPPDGAPIVRGDGGQQPRDGAMPADQAQSSPDGPTLPSTCPCPKDSYCDLSTNTCVLGCLDDSYCSTGKFCDMTAKLCKPGCRSVADCKDDTNPCTDLACRGGACVFDPNSAPCADDGNACTKDVCANGSCTHPPAANGKACGAAGDCSSKQCKSGSCTDVHAAPGAPCTDDGDSCTDDTCDGAGVCTHTGLPDGTDCPDTWPPYTFGAKCAKGKCTPLRYRCSGYSTLYYRLFSTGKVEKWTSVGSCYGCSGNTFKWSSYAAPVGLLQHSEYCSLCVDVSGSGDQCYDNP